MKPKQPLVHKVTGTNYDVTVPEPTLKGYKTAIEALENSMGRDADGSEYIFMEVEKSGLTKLIAHVSKRE